ncbi:MAG: hypothetical protein R6U58_13585 [Bacteroidales bacterium]
MIPKKVGHSIPLVVPDLPNVYTCTITFVEDNGAFRHENQINTRYSSQSL